MNEVVLNRGVIPLERFLAQSLLESMRPKRAEDHRDGSKHTSAPLDLPRSFELVFPHLIRQFVSFQSTTQGWLLCDGEEPLIDLVPTPPRQLSIVPTAT